jgi:hypothetical protein
MMHPSIATKVASCSRDAGSLYYIKRLDGVAKSSAKTLLSGCGTQPMYEALDIGWTELKLLEKYAMPMVPHRNHFLNDFYHRLASFWAVERGLFRSDEDERAIANFLFPDLHSA